MLCGGRPTSRNPVRPRSAINGSAQSSRWGRESSALSALSPHEARRAADARCLTGQPRSLVVLAAVTAGRGGAGSVAARGDRCLSRRVFFRFSRDDVIVTGGGVLIWPGDAAALHHVRVPAAGMVHLVRRAMGSIRLSASSALMSSLDRQSATRTRWTPGGDQHARRPGVLRFAQIDGLIPPIRRVCEAAEDRPRRVAHPRPRPARLIRSSRSPRPSPSTTAPWRFCSASRLRASEAAAGGSRTTPTACVGTGCCMFGRATARHHAVDRAGAPCPGGLPRRTRRRATVLRPISGQPIDRRDAINGHRIAKTAAIPWRISPHSRRHAAITNALDAGVPLRDAQILARHADRRRTEHYDRARGNLDRHASTSLPRMSRRVTQCFD